MVIRPRRVRPLDGDPSYHYKRPCRPSDLAKQGRIFAEARLFLVSASGNPVGWTSVAVRAARRTGFQVSWCLVSELRPFGGDPSKNIAKGWCKRPLGRELVVMVTMMSLNDNLFAGRPSMVHQGPTYPARTCAGLAKSSRSHVLGSDTSHFTSKLPMGALGKKDR